MNEADAMERARIPPPIQHLIDCINDKDVALHLSATIAAALLAAERRGYERGRKELDQ